MTSQTKAFTVIQQLQAQATERNIEFSRYSTVHDVDSDDHADAEALIFDKFYETERTDSIKKMCNFTPFEFRRL